MRTKLTTLLFGLLLAVGWTSSAFAQSTEDTGPNGATYKESVVSTWTYTWTDANGGSHENSFTDVATDPYQMYELLRQVYMDKRFPGPSYSAYNTADYSNYERKVYYGGVEGGWDIGLTYGNLGNITINVTHQWSWNWGLEYHPVLIESIKVISGGTVITKLDYEDVSGTMPNGWTINGSLIRLIDGQEFTFGEVDNQGNVTAIASGGSFTISSSLLTGYHDVQVVIEARSEENNYRGSISVNNSSKTIATTAATYSWGIAASVTNVAADGTYTPDKDGYTALMVSLNNTMVHAPKHYPENDNTNWDNYFTTKAEIIEYLTNNVQSIRLLTDGLRIGSADDFSRGTVFNCDGVYNKFFILSKGQSRQKDQAVLDRQTSYGYLLGERVLFKELYEEFSPTDGSENSQITDFYAKMTEGSVYEVQHDCASVIENEHEFSMSGKEGTTAYPMSGLNFFIPDFRLKYWTTTFTYSNRDYTVDGRTMNPYIGTRNGSTTEFRTCPNFTANYAQYNLDYRPKMGIYLIHLEANAQEVAQVHEPGNLNYEVTLEWTSSLNEMANPDHEEGKDVPQIFTVYYYDNDGNLQPLVVEGYTNTNGETGVTTLTYRVEQREHSYTINYIIKGRPNDSAHPSFIAWSNTDGVVIPGWNDFVGLDLDHFESDFETTTLKNWYRNFLLVKNDVGDGLTVDKVKGGMESLNVYRYEPAKDENNNDIQKNLTKIATLTFNKTTATAEQVEYEVEYVEANQQILNTEPLADPTDKYDREKMSIPDEGIVRVKGNGDIVIWPNGYWVNFKKIVVRNNLTNQIVASWTEGQDLEARGMNISDGSEWEAYTTDAGDNVHYIEGGGYIYIPNILNNSSYTNLTVEILAYADGSNTAKITVNDVPENISNTPRPENNPYKWSTPSNAGAGILRLALPIVDQFNVDIPKDNKHPNKYGYVLKYEPTEGDKKESGSVEVPVLHTELSVNGFYTEAQVMADTDLGSEDALTPAVMSADVTLNLPVAANPAPEYVRLQGGLNVIPEPEKNIMSELFRRTAGDYREMDETSPLYVEDDTYAYPAGQVHYFLGDETTGAYGTNYISYAPSITANGITRRYYEDDHLSNSYGGPIWVSSPGKVEISGSVENSANSWWGSWTTDNGNKYTFFRAALNLDGYLPKMDVPKLSNPDYEPFMYRVWVQCEDMRNYKIDATTGRYVDDGAYGSDIQLLTAEPIYWPSGTAPEDNKCHLAYGATAAEGGGVVEPGTGNAAYQNEQLIFAAPVDAKPKYIVRFYYKNKKAASTLRGEDNQYFVVEGEFEASDVHTGLVDLMFNGEVESITYINAQGMKSDKPFNGVNIVVTRYSDGTVVTTKEVKY